MKEYAIYIRQGEGMPYIVSTYNNLFDVKEALYNMISLEEKENSNLIYFKDFKNVLTK